MFIVFVSRSLHGSEVEYTVTEKNLLSIVFACTKKNKK